MNQNAASQNDFTGDRTDGSMVEELGERVGLGGMNTDFYDVTDGLCGEQERVVASQPAASRFPKTDMKPEMVVVVCKPLVPTAFNVDFL